MRKTLTGKTLPPSTVRHDQAIFSLKVSPDNSKAACLYRSHDDGSDSSVIRILEVHSGDVIGDPINVGMETWSNRIIMSFSSNTKRLIVVGGRNVTIYRVSATGKLAAGPLKRKYTVRGAELSSDETRCLLLAWAHVSEVLDVPSWKILGTGIAPALPNAGLYTRVHISIDGNRVIQPDARAVTIFDVASLSASHHNISIASITPLQQANSSL